jgi:hypothetical protein
MPRYNNYNNNNNSYNNRNYNNNRNQSKKSGCSTGSNSDGKPWIRGWKVTEDGLINFIATPGAKSKKSKSKSGKEWVSVAAKFTNTRTGQSWWEWGLWDLSNKKLYFKDSNRIANPRARNGGYFGKHISRTY